ncbi:IclR family transcriptional regulator [Pelagibius sp. Alg239-R121]|uniref:IclR family transcriptional regulator n=1 Tax=Pelagibius sp. Alg239-R121 TaxID=2993448 RepID=UPI0024A69180|nr:IclR family transcriptional regulator [Pelagibius sp. Alg239-R121]
MKEQRVEAVERALSILEAFGEDRRQSTLAQLAEETGLYKSTILRLSASLERFGYLTRDEAGLFRLGPSVWRLGSIYRRSFDLGERIRPELRQLVEETGETASFYVREAAERVCLYRENSRHPIRHHLDEGVRLPMDRGAAAHALRAFTGAQDEASDEIRSAGFYVSVGERNPDLSAVAVPLLGRDGHLRGALAVSGLTSRFAQAERTRSISLLKAASTRLSKLLD